MNARNLFYIRSRAVPWITVACLLLLALGAASCAGRDAKASAVRILSEARTELGAVQSFRMDTQFSMPLEGSGHLTSVNVIWTAPDTILTLARGNGDPGFQQVYQQGDLCLARYGETEDWVKLETGCAEPGQVRPTFRAWLDMKDPEVLSESEGITVVRGKAASDTDNENTPPPIAIWELRIETATSLIQSATGYEDDGTTEVATVQIAGYNQSFTGDFSSLHLPEAALAPS